MNASGTFANGHLCHESCICDSTGALIQAASGGISSGTTIQPDSGGLSGGLSGGEIAGIVIGSVAALLILAVLIFFVIKKIKEMRAKSGRYHPEKEERENATIFAITNPTLTPAINGEEKLI